MGVPKVAQVGKGSSDLGCTPDHQRLSWQAPVALRQRRVSHPPGVRAIGTYVDVTPDGGHADGSPMRGATRAVLLYFVCRLRRGQVRRADPAVPEPGRPVDGRRCGSTDPHLNRIGRQRSAAGSPDGQRFVGGDLVAGEQLSEHIQSRLEARDPPAEGDPHTGELVVTSPQSTLQDEPSRSQ